MKEDVVAFDLEFNKLLPDVEDPEWEISPPQIVCACIVSCFAPKLYVSFEHDLYDDVCSMATLESFIDDLWIAYESGSTIVTWGGASGDWRVLLQTFRGTRYYPRIERMMISSIDIPFAATSYIGMMMGLSSASSTFGVHQKNLKDSHLIPEKWKKGFSQQECVLGRVISDAIATYKIYMAMMAKKQLSWTTRKGHIRSWNISDKCMNDLTLGVCRLKNPMVTPFIPLKQFNNKHIISWYTN